MAEEDLILDKEVITTINEVKGKLEKKRQELEKFKTELESREKEIQIKEKKLEKQIEDFNSNLNVVIKEAKGLWQ